MSGLTIPFTNPADALPKYFQKIMYQGGGSTQLFVSGGTGVKVRCGKSMFAANLAERIDPERFSIDDVVFTPRDYFNRLMRLREEKEKGRVIIWDEGEMIASAKSWQSVTNRAISSTIATQGYLNNLTIIVAPLFSMLDREIRKMMPHWAWCTKELHGGRPKFFAHFRVINTDLIGEKIYLRKLRFYDNVNKIKVMCKRIEFGLPSDDFVAAYRKKEDANKTRLLNSFDATVTKFEVEQNEENVVKVGWRQRAEELLKNPMINAELIEKGKISSASISSLQEYENYPRTDAAYLATVINLKWSGKKNG